jgi:ketosteroid isomerase-like protein
MITEDYVRRIFKGLEEGDGASFFEHVDDKVDWIVEGTHPLAGHYNSKSDFLAGTFAKLGKVLPNGAAVLNATGSQRVGPRHAAARLNESDLQQVADLVISSHRA